MNETAATGAATKTSSHDGLMRGLLVCGIVSSVLYLGTDILAATVLYPGYSYTAQQVSELSAIGAPTRQLWIAMSMAWALLVIAFAMGIWLFSGQKRSMRVTAILLAAFGVIGGLWALFAPMHQRGTVALATDASHIIFAAIQVLVMVLFIAFGSGARGWGFRAYSIATIIVMLGAGIFPSMKAQAIAAGEPTPWMGAIERVSVYLPVLWVGVFAVVLLMAATYAVHHALDDSTNSRY
jgi:hypothetical protein